MFLINEEMIFYASAFVKDNFFLQSQNCMCTSDPLQFLTDFINNCRLLQL